MPLDGNYLRDVSNTSNDLKHLPIMRMIDGADLSHIAVVYAEPRTNSMYGCYFYHWNLVILDHDCDEVTHLHELVHAVTVHAMQHHRLMSRWLLLRLYRHLKSRPYARTTTYEMVACLASDVELRSHVPTKLLAEFDSFVSFLVNKSIQPKESFIYESVIDLVTTVDIPTSR